MKNLSSSDVDFISNVIEDIDYLLKLGQSPRQIATETRHASVIIRRFALDNDLKRAATFAGVKLRLIQAPPPPSKEEINSRNILMAHTGLSRVGATQYNGFYSDAECLYLDVRSDLTYPEGQLDEFLKQPCILYHGQYATRADIIRYAANKMGGAHHGAKKVKNEDLISKAKGSVTFKPCQNGKYSIALEISRLLNMHDDVYPDMDALNLVHLEILSSARLLSTSPSVQNIKKQLATLVATR